jgi:hypothetical protein
MKSYANYPPKVQPAIIAILCFAYFVIAVAELYFLNPAYSLMRSFTGNYDLGSYEFLIATTFFSLGLGSLALGFGLYQGMARSARSWTGLLLLGIWGVGMLAAGVFPANEGGSTVPHMTTVLIAGIFPVEVEAYPETTFSFIHILALILSLPILSLGTILLSRRFKQDENWHPIHSMTLILAVVMCIASILFVPTLLFPGLLGYTRYNPLVFVMIGLVIGIIWLLLVTARLRFLFNRPVSK